MGDSRLQTQSSTLNELLRFFTIQSYSRKSVEILKWVSLGRKNTRNELL